MSRSPVRLSYSDSGRVSNLSFEVLVVAFFFFFLTCRDILRHLARCSISPRKFYGSGPRARVMKSVHCIRANSWKQSRRLSRNLVPIRAKTNNAIVVARSVSKSDRSAGEDRRCVCKQLNQFRTASCADSRLHRGSIERRRRLDSNLIVINEPWCKRDIAGFFQFRGED